MKKYLIRKINNAYTLVTVLFILTFLSIALLLTTFFVSFYLNLAAKKVKIVSEWKPFYEILNEIKTEYFENAIQEDYTSPFDGWFSEMPDELKGYSITCYPEDSKLDINHIDLLSFFDTEDNTDDSITENDKNKITILEEFDEYIYYEDQLKEYVDIDASSDINLDECISIYNVPNLNTVKIGRLELFLKSQNYDDSFIKVFINKIKNYRGSIGKYLKYPQAKTGVKEGLIINKSEYESLKDLKWKEENYLFKFFDYNGKINLNFVNETVFSIAFKACAKDDKEDYKIYWDKISEKQRQGVTIKESDCDKIFGNLYIKVGKNNILMKRWYYFEKIFSVDSSLFKINIIKNDKVLTAFLRKYKEKNSEVKIKVLKISVGDYEEQEEQQIQS